MASAAEWAASGSEQSFSSAPEPNAEELYDLGCAAMLSESYYEASEFFSNALHIRVKLHGEMAVENAQTFYKYGCALLKKAQADSEALVERGKGKASDNVAGNVDESEKEEDDKIEEDSGMAKEEKTDEEEEPGDLELAGRVLECARAIYAKEAKRKLAEVDVITTLAEVRLEEEAFLACFDDYSTALSILETLVEADDRKIAELCFKISVAKLLAVEPQEALDYCNRAISVSELLLERLNRELSTDQSAGEDHVEDTSKLKVESVSDCVDHVAQVKDPKQSLGAEFKEEVEDGGKLVGSNNLAESGGGEAKLKHSRLSSQAALKAEVKEIDEFLLDLRERVIELQLMEKHPSLIALATLDDFLSRNCDGNTQGSSSTAPVANPRVMGREVKRATLTPIVDEQPFEVQPKKRTTEDALQGGSSGETQIGFNGPS